MLDIFLPKLRVGISFVGVTFLEHNDIALRFLNGRKYSRSQDKNLDPCATSSVVSFDWCMERSSET